ncbi:hypothetical protein PBY51_019049 [Eleginops maclovinus]|nr:hypothetical protein PBY51_019049 [Eleginops maclovinus]
MRAAPLRDVPGMRGHRTEGYLGAAATAVRGHGTPQSGGGPGQRGELPSLTDTFEQVIEELLEVEGETAKLAQGPDKSQGGGEPVLRGHHRDQGCRPVRLTGDDQQPSAFGAAVALSPGGIQKLSGCR